ncbi:hypothetical protein BKK54_09935 [Rodentibacter genomosp. 1]|uniref:Bacterial Ig-like domain-containing protein n=1 Tax=Rodentibacter genomosp. 1 TaxID=1908264 RepID=A0A1V3J251_9PAST|nr:Ig-like domain-containing protein [Rodentibacter genomosp. 1]OOF48956.1 hypothetical protein BKK54_09935 [Rodentibacter genomosp. 1]
MTIIYSSDVVDPTQIARVTLTFGKNDITPGSLLIIHPYYGGTGARNLDNEGTPISHRVTREELGSKLVFGVPAPIPGEKISITYDIKAPTGYNKEGIYIDTIARADKAKQPSAIVIGNGDALLTSDEIDAEGKVAVTVTLPKGLSITDELVVQTNQGESKAIRLPKEVLDKGQVELKVDAPEGGENNELLVSAYIVDRHGNSSEVKDHVYLLDVREPEASVELNNITADNIINAQEARGNITVSGKVKGDFKEGDQVRIFLDANTYATRSVDAEGNFSAELSARYFVNDEDKTIKAVLTTHKNGKAFTFEGEKVYTVDTTVPNADSTQVTLDNITADNVINAQEAQGTVTISGRVSGEFNTGDQVRIFIDENTFYTRYVDEQGRFSADVPAQQLVNDADKTVYAVLTTTDSAGNTGIIRAEKQYEVDTTAPNADSTQVILDNITADNLINGAEAKGAVTISGRVSGEFNTGDQVRIFIDENTFYTRYVDEQGRFSADVSAQQLVNDADKTVYAVLTTTDSAGNTGTIRAEKQYAVDTMVDAQVHINPIGTVNRYGHYTISGKVTGEFNPGDQIRIFLDEKTYYTRQVDAEGKFSATVPGSLLFKDADKIVSAVLTTTDAVGNTAEISNAVKFNAPKATAGYFHSRIDGTSRAIDLVGLSSKRKNNPSELTTDEIGKFVYNKLIDAVTVPGSQLVKDIDKIVEEGHSVKFTAPKATAGYFHSRIDGSSHAIDLVGLSSKGKNKPLVITTGEVGEIDAVSTVGDNVINIGGSLVDSTIIDLGSGKAVLNTHHDGTDRSLGNDNTSDFNHLRIAENVDLGAQIYGGKGKDIIEIGGHFNGKMELSAGDDHVTYVQGVGRINGGLGHDTVKITGKGAILELKNFVEVETIDISGSGSNTLRINSDAASADRTTVFVKGDRDDKVDFGNVSPNAANLKEGNKGSWYKVGSTVKDGVQYDGYEFNHQDDTLVYVQANIQVV